MKNMNECGVWIDKKHATIVKLKDGQETINKIESGIDGHVRIDGDGKQFTRMGNQYFDSEKTLEEREKHELKNYFNEVILSLGDVDSILIMGPAEAKLGLFKEVEKHKLLAAKVKSVETAAAMSENQFAATVRDYYNIPHKGKE